MTTTCVRQSDHCAIKTELELDVVTPRISGNTPQISGNTPQINYNKKGGWDYYTSISNKYATTIKALV